MGVFSTRKRSKPRAQIPSNRQSQRPRSANTSAPAYIPTLTETPDAPAYNATRGLTAAATRIKLGDKNEAEKFRLRQNAGSSQWQKDAWEFYDAIGEIKYAFTLVGNIISRITLYPAVINDPSQTPVPVGAPNANVDERLAAACERALARLSSAFGGQAGLLRDAALNFSVSGECYLVQIPARPGDGLPESWDIRSTDEIIMDTNGNTAIAERRELVNGGSTNQKGLIQLPNRAFVGRLWRNHPRYSGEADSSMLALLDLCEELLLLNKTFRSTARSRLNSGMLFLPDGFSVAASADADMPIDQEGEQLGQTTAEEAADEFEDNMIDAMITPIKDEDSASAVVPLIIRGPTELGEKIRLIQFERSFDPALAARSDRVLERIMQGLDVPKDVVTGLASVKYSNAVQINESLYKSHVDPLMLMIVDALTNVYYRQALRAEGFSEAEVNRCVIWYDPSQVATRNDRAADSDAGFDRYAVSAATWRRTHGFSETDAPTADEIAIRMVTEKGSLPPDFVVAALSALSPAFAAKIKEVQQGNSPAPLPPAIEQALSGDQSEVVDGEIVDDDPTDDLPPALTGGEKRALDPAPSAQDKEPNHQGAPDDVPNP